MLQPRRYGGYEVGLDDFLRVVMEVGRADPGDRLGDVPRLGPRVPVRGVLRRDRAGRDVPRRRPRRDPVAEHPARHAHARSTDGWMLERRVGLRLRLHLRHPHDGGRRSTPPGRSRSSSCRSSNAARLDDWGGGQTLGLGRQRLQLGPRSPTCSCRRTGCSRTAGRTTSCRRRHARLPHPRQPDVPVPHAHPVLGRAGVGDGRRRARHARRVRAADPRAADELPAADAADRVARLPAVVRRGTGARRHRRAARC